MNDEYWNKIAESIRSPLIGKKCEGCKAIVGQSIRGERQRLVCGIERVYKNCSGPYGWEEFWKESEKE